MTFQDWLKTEEGRMVSFYKMPEMLEKVWLAAKRDSQAQIDDLKAELNSVKHNKSLDEALNMGDGVYRP